MKLTDAWFPVKRWDFNSGKIVDANLFADYRVLRAVATWKTTSQEKKSRWTIEPLFYLFGDTWGRVQWEFSINAKGEMSAPFQDWIDKDLTGYEKISVYDYYVKPNEKQLLDIVDSISVHSCRVWLRDIKKMQKPLVRVFRHGASQ